VGPGIAGAPFLLVRQAWRTAKALAEAAVLISVILFLFLSNLRAALVASFIMAPAGVFVGANTEATSVLSSTATDGSEMVDGAGEIVAAQVRYIPFVTPGDETDTHST